MIIHNTKLDFKWNYLDQVYAEQIIIVLSGDIGATMTYYTYPLSFNVERNAFTIHSMTLYSKDFYMYEISKFVIL